MDLDDFISEMRACLGEGLFHACYLDQSGQEDQDVTLLHLIALLLRVLIFPEGLMNQLGAPIIVFLVEAHLVPMEIIGSRSVFFKLRQKVFQEKLVHQILALLINKYTNRLLIFLKVSIIYR